MTARVMVGGNADHGFTAVVHDGPLVSEHDITAPNADLAARQAETMHADAVANGLEPASWETRLAALEAWVGGIAHQFGAQVLPAGWMKVGEKSSPPAEVTETAENAAQPTSETEVSARPPVARSPATFPQEPLPTSTLEA